MSRKFNKIQKDLDEINRKTYKNKEEYDKNINDRMMESGRLTENR